MKRSVEFLLVLPILLAIVFGVVAFRNGTLGTWFSSETPESPETPAPVNVALGTVTPTVPVLASVIPYYTSTSSAAAPPTSVPTFVVAAPATKTLVPTRTNTPLPTATRTLTATNTSPVTPTATPPSQEMLDGISAGNQVVRAIEDYYLNQGKYPVALSDLIAKYLPGVPVTPAGQPYFYRLFDAEHPLAIERYWLSFRVSDQENLTCTYMRRIEYWDCNYASP